MSKSADRHRRYRSAAIADVIEQDAVHDIGATDEDQHLASRRGGSARLAHDVDLNAVPITHPAEKQALMDLLTQLEQSDVVGMDQDEIKASREAIARDMGWVSRHPQFGTSDRIAAISGY